MGRSWRSTVRWVLVPTAGVVLGGYVLATLADWDLVVEYVRRADPITYAGAVTAYYVSVPVRTRRWRVYLDEIGVRSSAGSANVVVLLSLYVNTVLPAKAGDLYRCHLAAENYSTTRSEVLGTVALERAADIALLGGGVAASLVVVSSGPGGPLDGIVPLAALTVVAVLVIVAAVVRVPSDVVPARVATPFAEFRRGLRIVLSGRVLLTTVVLTVVLWGTNVARFWLILAALDISLGVGGTVLVALVVSFLTGLPYSPAGIGAVEVGGAAVLLALGVSGSAATAVVLLDRVITVGTVVGVGTVVYSMLSLTGSALLGDRGSLAQTLSRLRN